MADTQAAAPGGVSLISLIALAVGGLIPIWGVHAYGWDAVQVVILYWIETLVVGVFTWLRVAGAERHARSEAGQPFKVSSFFVMHYGLFALVHGIFAWLLAILMMANGDAGAVWGATLANGDFWSATMGLVLLQGMVFWREWARPQAWRTADAQTEMVRPYGRVFAMHVAVIVGFLLIGLADAPVLMVLILCGLKLVIDLGLELWSAGFRVRFEPLVERR